MQPGLILETGKGYSVYKFYLRTTCTIN
ncbi:oligogalacturonate-specific porin KdgM family protein [Yersinia intermedia]